MAAALVPRFAQHEEKITLDFVKQKKSELSCNMIVINQATKEEIFHTKSWNTSTTKQIAISSKEKNGKDTRLYVLKVKEKEFKRFYQLTDGLGLRSGVKDAELEAEPVGGRYGRRKNDFVVQYRLQPEKEWTKLLILKSESMVSSRYPGCTDIRLIVGFSRVVWILFCSIPAKSSLGFKETSQRGDGDLLLLVSTSPLAPSYIAYTLISTDIL